MSVPEEPRRYAPESANEILQALLLVAHVHLQDGSHVLDPGPAFARPPTWPRLPAYRLLVAAAYRFLTPGWTRADVCVILHNGPSSPCWDACRDP